MSDAPVPPQATARFRDTAHSPHLRIAEDGEVLGTVQQFATRLNLSPSKVLSCLQEKEAAPVFLSSREAGPRVVVIEANGVDALLECAPE